MSKMGDLSGVFGSEVPNLEWLSVSEADYREIEKLPKQNVDTVPDLEAAWSHGEDPPFHLVPNIDKPGTYVDLNSKKAMDESAAVASVVREIKDRMMMGWDGAKMAAWIRERVHSHIVTAAMPEIRKIADEQNLLGNVYIDVREWDRCASGEGKDIARRASMAKYALSTASKCGQCIFNDGGRCSKFKKELVFDVVPYDDQLVDEYAAKLKIPGSTSLMASANDPKERIRAMFAHVPDADTDVVASYKPTEGPQVKRDRKAAQFYEPPSANFERSADRSLYRDLAHKMMAAAGALSDVVKSRFAHATSEVVKTLQAEENLLGKLYVRADQFNNCHQANDFLRRHRNAAPNVLEIPKKCERCVFNRSGACSLLGKQVVREVPYTRDLLANELNALVGAGKMAQEQADTYLARAASEPIKDLVREAHSYKAPAKKHTYVAKYEVSERGSASAPVKERVVAAHVPRSHRTVVASAYKKLYAGIHGDNLKHALVDAFGRDALIEATQHLTPVVRMAGVLGNVVLDMRGFQSPTKAKEFLASKGMAPRYILKESCCGSCGTEACGLDCDAKHFPKLEPISYDELEALPAEVVSSYLTELNRRGRLSAEQYTSLASQVGSVNSLDLLRIAYLTTPPKAQRVYSAEFKVAELSAIPADKAVVREANAVPMEHRPLVRAAYKMAYDRKSAAVISAELETKYGEHAFVAATDYVQPILRVASLLGREILDLRGFKDEREARSYLATNRYTPKYIVKESCCGNCGTSKCLEGCATKSFPGLEVISMGDLSAITNEKVLASIQTLEQQGRIASGTSYDLQLQLGTKAPVEVLKAAYEAPRPKYQPMKAAAAKDLVPQAKAVTITATMKEDFKRRVVQAMNRGLYGDDLKRWLKNSFEEALIKESADYLRTALSEQGLLGHHYVDPRPYKACTEGADAVKSVKAAYVQEMPKCVGCIYRNANSQCSLYKRQVVASVPYPQGKVAAQEAILNPVVAPKYELPSVNVNPVGEFDLDGGSMPVDVTEVIVQEELDVTYEDPLGNV